MKRIGLMICTLLIIFLFAACDFVVKSPDDTQDPPSTPSTELTINFTDGTAGGANRIYAVWMENTAVGFFQDIYICDRIVLKNLSGTGLPYWQENKRTPQIDDQAYADTVSGATKATGDIDFIVSLDDAPALFTVYFEIDHSFDENDWFTVDQPAILYSIVIDTSDVTTVFQSNFIGWTPNENTENIIPSTPFGELQTTTDYITTHLDGFADDRTATKLVGGLTASVIPH